jgi:protein TonB
MERTETHAHLVSRRSAPRNERPVQQLTVLGLIFLLHGGLFLAMQANMDHAKAPVAVQREVFARFIRAEPERAATAPAAPELAAPKPARPPQRPKPSIAKPRPLQPVVPPRPEPRVSNSPLALTAPPVSKTPPAQTVQSESPSTSSDAPRATDKPATTAPSASAVPAAPRTVSGVQYIRPPAPDYPALSRRMKEEGTVRLRILVNESGRAQNVDVEKSSNFTRLDNAAREAVQLALFKPHLEDGRPVPVYVSIPINFSLQ